MNTLHDEYMAEYLRQEIIKQSEQIRLEQTAAKSRTSRPAMFERAMYNFANWMITTGKQFRKRYETPTINCPKSQTNGFAR